MPNKLLRNIVFCQYSMAGVCSGVVRGVKWGRRPWGHNSTLFVVILNIFLSRNLDESMGLRPRTLVCLRRLGVPPPDPCVVTHTYYYNFVEFVSSVKYILFCSKKNQVTTANVLPLLLPQFCTHF